MEKRLISLAAAIAITLAIDANAVTINCAGNNCTTTFIYEHIKHREKRRLTFDVSGDGIDSTTVCAEYPWGSDLRTQCRSAALAIFKEVCEYDKKYRPTMKIYCNAARRYRP